MWRAVLDILTNAKANPWPAVALVGLLIWGLDALADHHLGRIADALETMAEHPLCPPSSSLFQLPGGV